MAYHGRRVGKFRLIPTSSGSTLGRWVAVGCLLAGGCKGPDRAGSAKPAKRSEPKEEATSGTAAPSSAAARFERLYFPPEGELFQKKLPPRDGEWLAHFKEPGQDFSRYQSTSPNRPTPERTRIVLQPLGSFSARDHALMKTLSEHLALFFELPVDVENPLPLPVNARRLRDEDGKRWVQHHTKVLLEDVLRPRVPKDAIVYVGVLLEDLYPAESWNYVFGQATLDERVGVHSLARFFPEFWGQPDTPDARRKGLLRSVSVLAHETGHAFGIEHCIAYECVMNGSNSLNELDRQFHELCPICLRKLSWNIGFEPVARYQKLRNFYRREGLADLAGWMDRRLEQIGP